MIVTVEYKWPQLEAELVNADPRMPVMVYYLAGYVKRRGFGPGVLVTQVRRSRGQQVALHGPAAPISVHEVDPCRGVDVRTRNYFTPDQAAALEEHMREEFDYSAHELFHSATYETQEKAIAAGRDPALPPIAEHLHLQAPAWYSAGPPRLTLFDPSKPA